MNQHPEITKEEFIIIEQYLLKKIPEEEYEAFTMKLLKDTTLSNKVRSIQLLMLGVQESELVERLEIFHAALSKPLLKVEPKRIATLKTFLLAASIIVIVGVGLWLMPGKESNTENLYKTFYKQDPGLISEMSSSDNYQFDRAMIDYKISNYDSAIAKWNKLLPASPANDTLHYFLASAHLAEMKTGIAIRYFKEVIKNKKSYFLQDAYWYTGLALLKEGKINEAIFFIQLSTHTEKEKLLIELNK